MAGRRRSHSQEPYDLGSLIARARRLVWLTAARRLEAHGEAMLVWQVLNRLRYEGPLTQRELASQCGQHPAGISRLLDTLERDAAVRRTRNPADRRKLEVTLTATGRRRLAASDAEVDAAAEEVFAPLGGAERRALAALLAKLIGARGPHAPTRAVS